MNGSEPPSRSTSDRKSAGTRTFLNTGLGLTSETTAGTSTWYSRDDLANLVAAQVGSGAQDFALTDITGSVTALVRSNGTVDAAYAYDPYDRVLVHIGGDSRFQFAGGETDTESGLVHFGERYYDATLMRWTQEDPIAQASNLVQGDRYTHAGGDPVNHTDCTGEAAARIPARARLSDGECSKDRIYVEFEFQPPYFGLELYYDIFTGTLCDVYTHYIGPGGRPDKRRPKLIA